MTSRDPSAGSVIHYAGFILFAILNTRQSHKRLLRRGDPSADSVMRYAGLYILLSYLVHQDEPQEITVIEYTQLHIPSPEEPISLSISL